MAKGAVGYRSDMGRKPTTPKEGEPFRLHVLLPGKLVLDIDAIAVQLKERDPYKRVVTRTDALVMLLSEAIKARKGKQEK